MGLKRCYQEMACEHLKTHLAVSSYELQGSKFWVYTSLKITRP